MQYDKRNEAELRELFNDNYQLKPRPLQSLRVDFPEGCDFLIAHNVLEHCVEPISVLLEWHGNVRDGGVVVLSLPDSAESPDKDRRVAGIDHLLLDYALQRGEQDFESREHILSFLAGWQNDLWLKDASQARFAQFLLDEANRDAGHDLHWHAFTPALALRLVAATVALSGRGAQLLAYADPRDAEAPTLGDIILVYRLGGDRIDGIDATALADCRAAVERIAAGLGRLQPLRAAVVATEGKAA